MAGALLDKELIRDCYIAIESLRRSADLLQGHLFEWIGKVLRATDDRGEEWVSHRRQLWLGLSIDPETADLLAADLQLWWEDGCLCIPRLAFADVGARIPE